MKRAFLSALCCLALAGQLTAAGLDVSPAVHSWQRVCPGKEPARPMLLKITNRSTERKVYSLRPLFPRELNTLPGDGFKPLPERSWLRPATPEVAVPPGQTARVPISLLVPAAREHFGQAWLIFLEVKEKLPNERGISMACYPKIYVRTIK